MAQNLGIFGAGASIAPGNSPALGNKLYETLKLMDPAIWNQIPSELIPIFQNDIEKGMTSLWNGNSHLLPNLHKSMALYFSQFYPSPESLYRKIAEKLTQQWNGDFITLNYERLLEISISEKGIHTSILGKSDPPMIEMCYPHGCCNFFNNSIIGTAGGVSFSPGVSTNGTLEIITNTLEIQRRIQTNAFPPIMSYFLSDKNSPSGQNIINTERERFNDLVENADNIAVIGIRVREHDKHIWDKLAKTSGKIMYCSGKSSGAEFKKWSKKNSRNDIILKSYWGENFEEICDFIELN